LAAGAAASVLLLVPVLLASGARAADAPPKPAPVATAAEPEDATVAVDSGNEDQAFLYGSFLRPANKNSYPAVLILPEAGADRNGNAADQELKPDTYRELAQALAAKKVKVCAIIEAAGASRPFAAVLAAQLKTAFQANKFTKEDYDQATRILDQLAAGKPVADPPKKLDALFRKSVQPYLISWLNLNPVEALKTNTPVLIIQGSGDFELTSDDPRRLSASPKNVRVVMVPGADHDLKIRVSTAGKAKADEPPQLAPQVVPAIQTFLDAQRFYVWTGGRGSGADSSKSRVDTKLTKHTKRAAGSLGVSPWRAWRACS
jgi:pimeloyl-ACP methyl ester carboxylesterase